MGDSTIKPDSGNDLVLQNNGGAGKIEINNDNTIAVTGTVSGITATEVGLGNVDNTSDANKPVSTAQQSAIDLKANIASPTFTGNVNLASNATGTFNGTFGDSATMSNKYYRTASINASKTISSSGEYINTDGSTVAYFLTGTGDSTNIEYTSTNNIKIVRAGVYIISFSASFLLGGTTESRIVLGGIDLGGSVNPTSRVATAFDQISNTGSSVDDYGGCTAVWVGHCSANSYVRFWVQGYNSGTPYVQSSTQYCIGLLRPT
jgi:hypothetical protein